MKARAWWNNRVVAASDDVIEVDGRRYFPRADVDPSFLQESQTSTVHPEKGPIAYFHVVVDGALNADAAYVVTDPEPGYEALTDRVAFWHGIEVEET